MHTFRHPVSAQVDIVLEDERFRASDRLRRLLRYLCERSVGGGPPPTQNEIAMQVLELAHDFDSTVDSRIRVEVLRLRKALDVYNHMLPPDAPKLTVPLGAYALRLQTLPAPELRRPAADTGVPILIAVNHSRDEETDEQFAFCLNEVLQLCAMSPLVGPGRLNLHLVDVTAGSDPTEEGRRIGAQAFLSLRAQGRGAAFSLCATATAMPSHRVLACIRAGAAGFACTTAEATTNAARQVAALIADPLTGIARQLHEITPSKGCFGATQAAYEYVRTQRIGQAGLAWDRLVGLRSNCPADATTLALQADMCRVLAVAGQQETASFAHALDLAEQAVLLAPDNSAARLSLGYAQLALGDVSDAARTAGQLKQARFFGSIQEDASLLSVLAGCDAPGGAADPKPGSQTFIGLASAVIHHLGQNELSAAAEALSVPQHDSIHWTQLFRVLVMQTLGERALARQSARQLHALCPEFRVNGENIIRSFFGQRTLGMQLEASYKEVVLFD